jgi:hypothetical protein
MPSAQLDIRLVPIGKVESPLTDRVSAPKQGYEASPEAWLVFEPWVLQAFRESGRAMKSSS